MPAIRSFNFLTGFTTPTQPSDITPVSDTDLVDKEYVDDLINGTEISFTLANNQAAASNVTGISFAGATYKSAQVKFWIRRTSTTTEKFSAGTIYFIFDSLNNVMDAYAYFSGENVGVEFSCTTGGQLQYTTTNFSGTGYVGTGKFKWTVMDTISV